MKMRFLAPVLLVLIATPAAADPPKGFVERVESLRKQTGAPGVAIAIVEKGKTTMIRGWGVRKLGASAPVGPHTLFQTGSTGKAFTATALAMLVDQGKIAWDDRVIDHMPWFRMYDPYVTREMTVRDLLVHRSGLGLGAGDLLFVPRSDLSRKESVRRLAFIKPATSFRASYAYDNILYMVAGQLIEEVSGKSWERFMIENVLRPGGMTDATADSDVRFSRPDRSHPHARLGGALRGDGDQQVLDERAELGRNAAPAGGLALSATDLARWLQIQLRHGKLPSGGQLFSEASALEMWKPVIPMPIPQLPEPLALAMPKFNSYALGWNISDYRGARMISHAGGVFGSITMVVLLPDQDVGFAIVMNSEESGFMRGLMYELLDHYLDLPNHDWPTRWAAFMEQRIAGGKAALAQRQASPAKVGPSLGLDRYAGTYKDPWYGNIVVGNAANGLTIDFKSTPRMAGRLEHWQYDTFVTRFDDTSIEPAYVTFALDADGKVSRVTMKAVSPLADFSYDYHDLDFAPVAAK